MRNLKTHRRNKGNAISIWMEICIILWITESYEQIPLSKAQVEDAIIYLKENDNATAFLQG